MLSTIRNQGKLFSKTDYQKVMRKWELIDDDCNDAYDRAMGIL